MIGVGGGQCLDTAKIIAYRLHVPVMNVSTLASTCAASSAHSIHYGLTIVPGLKGAFHGELVAYGLLCQFVLEGKPREEIVQMMRFYQKINLPISLFDMGATEWSESELRKAAAKAFLPEEAIHRLPFPIREEDVYQSILRIHDLGEIVKMQAHG